MDISFIEMEPGIKDITAALLSISAQTIAQGVDGSIFIVLDGALFQKRPDSDEFIQKARIDESKGASILAFDNSGNLYHSGYGTGILYRSRDYGQTFKPCLADAGGHCFRGFAIDQDGSIYTGSYAGTGPATIYRSDNDGCTWTPVAAFDTRHIHDVAVNPYNNWIYAIAGEREEPWTRDAYYVFRSKDRGETWDPVLHPAEIRPDGSKRPLYFGLNFIGDLVVLSTDHFEGRNGIDIFRDTGGAGPYATRRVFTNPHSEGKRPSYCWRIANWNGCLYAVCAGEKKSVLIRSEDGENWEKCAVLGPNAGTHLEFFPWDDSLLVTSPDAAIEIRKTAKSRLNLPDMEDKGVFWLQRLYSHDKRFKSELCKGYYYNILGNRDRQKKILRILEENGVNRHGLIADVGCGAGVFILSAAAAGYANVSGVDANPRWLIACRRLYEATFQDKRPDLQIVPRGSFTLPATSELFDAILIMMVFTGNGNNVPLNEAFEKTWGALKSGGLLYFDLSPATYGETSPEIFLRRLAEIGFTSLRCFPDQDFKGQWNIIARKP